MKLGIPHSSSLRSRIVALSAVLVLLSVLCAALLMVRFAGAEREFEHGHDLGIARALAAEVDSALTDMRAALLALSAAPAVADRDFPALYRQAKIVAGQHRARIVLSDREGHPIFDTALAFGTGLPDLEDPQLARQAASTGAVQVSNLFYGSVTREPLVAVFVPVGPAGGTGPVFMMTVRPEMLSRIFAEQQAPPSWTVSVVDRSGRIIGRSQGLGRFLGIPAGAHLLRAIGRTAEGVVTVRTEDRGDVDATFRKSALSGWTVAVEIPRDQIDAPLWESIGGIGSAGLLLLVLGGLIAVAMARSCTRGVNALSQAAAALGRAESPPPLRSRFREMNDAIEAMRQAAFALRRRAAERERADAALHEARQRLLDFALTSSDLFWEQDAQFRFSWISSNPDHPDGDYHFLLGKTRWERADTAPGTDWATHEADLEAHRPFRNFRYARRKPDGSRRYLRSSGRPVFDERGEFRGYRGTVVDDTDLVEALRRAEASEALLRDAIESIPEGFVIFDRDDRLVMCNEAYRGLYPHSAHAMVPGTRFDEIVRVSLAARHIPDAVGREEQWIEERLRWRRRPVGAIERQLADGRWVLVTERRMRNSGTAGLRVDISALKAA